MATTVAGIIRKAVTLHASKRGHVARAGGTTALTATGGAAQTLIDTVGYPQGVSETYYKGWWIWDLTTNLIRPVSAQTQSAATYTHDGNAWTVPSSGNVYMILRDHPETWWESVNTALSLLLSQRDYYEFTPTDDTEDEYTFGVAPLSLTGLKRETQVFRVEYRDAGDDDAPWLDWADGTRTWRAHTEGATHYLDFGGSALPSTSDRMRLTILKQYPVASATDTSIDVDEEWAAEATLLAMARTLKTQAPGDEWAQIERDAAHAYLGLRGATLGTDSFRSVGRSQRRQGGSGVQGRGGMRRVFGRSYRW